MMFKERIAVYSENNAKPINTIYDKIQLRTER
jgi:hypothetical protein